MDPDELLRWELVLDTLQAAFYHDPPVICMNSDILI